MHEIIMRSRHVRIPAVAILLLLLTSGCAVYPEPREENSGSSHITRSRESVPTNRSPEPGNRGPSPASDNIPRASSNSGVATLLQQASQARMAGDLTRAQSLAERAQTIEPRQAHSYLELARIYQARGDHNRARQMALRGLSYAGDDQPLKQSLQQFSAP